MELVPVCLVQNLAAAIAELQGAGVACVGLDGTATTPLHDVAFDRPTVLVLGAEGKGLRQATTEACDTLATITTAGPIASLNVSNATAVALHQAMLGRSQK
ncbi:MAG: TrmH family RNA methyltransferase, partial [Pseudomonadota bacterium]